MGLRDEIFVWHIVRIRIADTILQPNNNIISARNSPHMPGELEGRSVFIRDVREASQTYSKGNFGYPMSGGFLELDLVEAAFLVQADRLEVFRKKKKLDFSEIFDYASGKVENFDIKFIVFKDLRERGFIVKPESGNFDLRVYPRGMSPSNSSPLYMVCAVSERAALDIGDFMEEVAQSEDRGKQLLYGVVDEEGDLTYYKMAIMDPEGSVFPGDGSGTAAGRLVGDRIFVFDGEQGRSVREDGFYGKDMKGVLQLSLIEGCYLMDRGSLAVTDRRGKQLSVQDLIGFGKKTQDEFLLRLRTYRDLRDRGLVVKTGFKYGTHFRVYEKSPDDCHARYLVHAVPASTVAMWPEISRTVRLSGGVKKEILFARVSGEVEYLEFKWFKP